MALVLHVLIFSTNWGHGMAATRVRARFWIEVIFASLAFALMTVTLINHEWIEWLTGAEPDGGSGLLEWAVVIACAIVAVAFAAQARREWRRAAPQPT